MSADGKYVVVPNEQRRGQHETLRVTAYGEARVWGERVCDGTQHHYPLDAVLGWFDHLLTAEAARERADAAWRAAAPAVDRAEAGLIAALALQRAACRRAVEGG